MSLKTRAQLQSDSISRFPDNNNKEITAERVRNHTIDVQDSFVSKFGDTGIQDVIRYLSTVVIGNDYDLITKKYFDDNLATASGPTWLKAGNTITSRGIFGSTSGAFGWDYKVDNVTYGSVSNSGVFSWNKIETGSGANLGLQVGSLWAQSAAVNNCFFTDNIYFDGGFKYAQNGFGLLYYFVNGGFELRTAPSGLAGNGASPTNRFIMDNNGCFGFGNTGTNSAILKYNLAYNTQNTVEWWQYDTGSGMRDIFRIWTDGNVGFGGQSFGNGTGVVFFAEELSATNTDPVGGAIHRIINDAVWYQLSDGSLVLVAGLYVTQSGNYTQQVGEQTLEYTGTGGHTFTLHTAVGYKGTEITVINNGSGNLTVNGGTLTVGVTLKIKSNGTNWL